MLSKNTRLVYSAGSVYIGLVVIEYTFVAYKPRFIVLNFFEIFVTSIRPS